MAIPSAELVKDVVAQVEGLTESYNQQMSVCSHRVPHGTTVFGVMRDLPAIDDVRTVDLVLNTCLQRGPQRCACVVAVRYNRVEVLLRSAPSLVPELEDPFWKEALLYLVRQNRWSSIQTLLVRGTGRVCWNSVGHRAAACFHNHPAAVTVFDMLSARCRELECSCIENYLILVIGINSVDRFKKLVYSESSTIRRLVLRHLRNVVFVTCMGKACVSSDAVRDLHGLLTVACEAGLFTTEKCTALLEAVDQNQPDVVCYLYHAGAPSNRFLSQLSRLPALEAKTKADPTQAPQWHGGSKYYPSGDNVEAAKSIQSFLSRVASSPRSLETLCLQQFSRRLGWGHGRESRIEKMSIPSRLKDKLKFRDQTVLLKDTSQ